MTTMGIIDVTSLFKIQNKLVTYQTLCATIKKNKLQVDLDMLMLAYEYAKEAHRGQIRKTGEPYIHHCLAVANYLAELRMDKSMILAGLLHDVPEDTERTLTDIKKEFGEDVAWLVEGITKLGHLKYRGVQRYVENLRRMFVSMAQDIRVVIIKLCDRIHNLSTLDALPPEKAQRIALESLEIYAPIANRLGMGEIKGVIEDLSFPYVFPKDYKLLMELVKKEYVTLEKVIVEMKDEVKKILKENNIPYISVHARQKHYLSLWRKLQRYDNNINKVYDLIALRIIVDGSDLECYQTLGVIHAHYTPLAGRLKDYIAQPKPNGYQSLHTTVFGAQNKIVEVQIRTQLMHEEDEFGIAAHWQYKERVKLSEIDKQKYNWLQKILEMQTQDPNDEEYLASLKIDIFQNYLFVFTPKGEVIELPEDSTPVDFAYAIHTEVGDHCESAKVNDLHVPLNHILKNGDVVEIITNKTKWPTFDWLKFVKTTHARKSIKHYHQSKRSGFLKKLLGRG